LTSYEQLRIQKKLLMGVSWGYAILDEGHKIRNPDADVTLVAKQLQTVPFSLIRAICVQCKGCPCMLVLTFHASTLPKKHAAGNG